MKPAKEEAKPTPTPPVIQDKPAVPVAPPKAKPERVAKPKPKPKPKAAIGHGNLQISTTPPVPIRLNGRAVGQTFKLKNTSGTLIFGSGDNRQSNPI